MRMHARPVSIENPDDFDRHIMLSAIVEKQRLRATFPLIIAGPHADWVDVAPIFFRLRMDVRIPVDFRGRCLKDFDLEALGEAEHVDGADDTRLRGLGWVELVMHWRRGTREIEDFVDFDEERKSHIMSYQLHARIREQVCHIMTRAREEVIDAENVMPSIE